MKRGEKAMFGIDMDQVLNWWEGNESPWLKILSEVLGTETKMLSLFDKEHEVYEVTENYPNDLREAIRNIYTNPPFGFYENMPIMPGAIDAVHGMMELYDIVVITTPVVHYGALHVDLNEALLVDNAHIRVTGEKIRWLRKHFGLKAPRLIGFPDKTFIKADVLIDDNPDVAKNKRHEPSWVHMLYGSDRYQFSKKFSGTDIPMINFGWDNWKEATEGMLEKIRSEMVMK